MLTGQELLDFVTSHEEMNQAELAEATGYTRVTKTNKHQVLVSRFNQALLKAKGLNVRVGRAPGKTAQYFTTVHRSGVILVGTIYAHKFGVKPGDELEIHLEDECIRLVPRPVNPAAAAPSPGVRAKA
jgi:hypothetical protein